MKANFLLLLVLILTVSNYQELDAMEIEGGKLADVVVVSSGVSDSTFVTELTEGWYSKGPQSFDIDKDGNIYVLDWLGERVVKFSKDGKWMLTFPVPRGPFGLPGTRSGAGVPGMPQTEHSNSDIAVDNWGNVYVTTGNTLKFSAEGKLLFRMPTEDDKRKGNLGYGTSEFITVDKDGRFYNFADKIGQEGMHIDIYTPEGQHRAKIYHKQEYPDRVIVQKEVGNDIYFRVNKYLMKTTLEDYPKSNKFDTVAVLPVSFRLFDYYDKLVSEAGPLPSPSTLIGFDKDNCFYFHEPSYQYGNRSDIYCQYHTICKYRLENKQFKIVGIIHMRFRKGKDVECTDRGFRDFTKYKQFIVTGDGTIYFLHGTVDTVKVSKIIMDECKPLAK